MDLSFSLQVQILFLVLLVLSCSSSCRCVLCVIAILKLLTCMFVSVNQLFFAVNRNDVVGLKWLLEGNGCKSLLDQPDSKSGLSLLMTAALSGRVLYSFLKIPYVEISHSRFIAGTQFPACCVDLRILQVVCAHCSVNA